MMTTSSISSWYSLLNSLLAPKRSVRGKVHDYAKAHRGEEYLFEEEHGDNLAYMTGHGGAIVAGDWLLLNRNGQTIAYQVQTIDYYAFPAEMWIAALSR